MAMFRNLFLAVAAATMIVFTGHCSRIMALMADVSPVLDELEEPRDILSDTAVLPPNNNNNNNNDDTSLIADIIPFLDDLDAHLDMLSDKPMLPHSSNETVLIANLTILDDLEEPFTMPSDKAICPHSCNQTGLETKLGARCSRPFWSREQPVAIVPLLVGGFATMLMNVFSNFETVLSLGC